MQVTTKYRLGKLPEAGLLADDFGGVLATLGFAELPISVAHAATAGSLRIDHKDPFDRLLIAQAQVANVAFASNETIFDGFGVRCIW